MIDLKVVRWFSIRSVAGAILLLATLTATSDAALLGYDPFHAGGAMPDTAVGQYETGTGYTGDFVAGQDPTVMGFGSGPWTSAGSYANFVYYRTESGQLTYTDASGQQLATRNGQLNLFRSSGSATDNKDVTRDISVGTSLPDELYYSLIVQISAGKEFSFNTSSTDGGTVRPYGFGIDENGNPYVYGSGTGSGTDTNTGITVTPDVPHLLVAKLTNDGFDSDQIDLYLDPILGNEAANTPIATIDGGDFYVGGNPSWGVGDLTFSNVIATPGSIIMDEIRIGSTFDDVTPAIPEPSTLALAAIGLIVGAGLRRRRA